MIKKIPFIILFSNVSLLALFLVQAQGESNRCLPCEDLQHSASLSAIEKRLSQANDNSLQALDKEAKDWYAKFQKGGLFFDGWKEISEDVVAKVPNEKKITTKVTMLALGVRIGCEWSKENDVRKISTDMLQVWGKQLRKTVENSPHSLLVVITSIESEVDALLL